MDVWRGRDGGREGGGHNSPEERDGRELIPISELEQEVG